MSKTSIFQDAVENYGNDMARTTIARFEGALDDATDDGMAPDDARAFADRIARDDVAFMRGKLEDLPFEWPQYVAALTTAGFGRWIP